MHKRLKICFIGLLLFYLWSLGCNKKTTEPDQEIIPLDGRGGGVIAYCYQPLQNGIHQIYALNADGSGNQKLIEASIGLNHHDWSPDTLQIAAVGYVNDDTWSIHVFDANGTNLTRLTTTSDVWDNDPAWSPDGSHIAFTRIYPSQNREEIWIMNADGSNQHYIGIEGGSAKWSPGGTRLIYHSLRNDNYNIYTSDIDGQNEQSLTSATTGEIVPVWSPDGSQIVFTRVEEDLTHEICIMDSNGTNLRQLTEGGAPKWSPDGSLIAFHSGPFEQWEVFIINFDGTNRRQVTNSPTGITAINPVWRPE